MPPDQLARWEPILQSPVAVALLLLAGMAAQAAVSGAVIRLLWRELRATSRELQDHLAAQADFTRSVANVRQILTLTDRRKRVTAPPSPEAD